MARLADVTARFPLRGGVLGRVRAQVHAVERVSLSIRRAETLALVGESGCGKSTIARVIVGLVPHAGRIEVAGRALADLDRRGRMGLRRRVQMVFQDPTAAPDPRMTAGALIAEPLAIHRIGGPREQAARVAVMSLGRIVEMGTRDRVSGDPRHPYTRRLIDAAPVPDPARRRPPSVRLTGEIPSPIHPLGRGPAPVTLRDVGGGRLVALD